MRGRRWWAWVGAGSWLFLLAAADLSAQDVASEDRVRVFFDCQAFGCDFTYTRRAITWVDWVRDRQDADVHLLVTSVATGGGTSFEISMLGLRDFEGEDRTFSVQSSTTDTQDERRARLAERFALGLTSYVAGTPVADLLSVEYDDPAESGEESQTLENDPWNLWVFNVRLGGSLRGQSSIKDTSVNGSLSANRTSELWKLRWGSNIRYSENEFELSEDEKIISIRRTMGTDFLLVRSLGPNWGLGGRSSLTSSLFANHDIRFVLQPAVEYNIFPYEESSRRTFTFQYRVGPQFVRYDEETILNKLEETIWENALTASLGLQQPWGRARLSLTGSAFIDDWTRNEVGVFGNIDLRITRGLDLGFFGEISRVRNRVNVPLRDATEDEVLLRQRILETDFSYFFNVSLSYRFGSIFNSIVNPRFDGGGLFFF